MLKLIPSRRRVALRPVPGSSGRPDTHATDLVARGSAAECCTPGIGACNPRCATPAAGGVLRPLILIFLAMALLAVGCAGDAGELPRPAASPQATVIAQEATAISEEVTTPAAEATPVQDQEDQAEAVTSSPTAETPEATATPQPSPTPTLSPVTPELVNYGFGQDQGRVGYGFLVKNPETESVLQNVTYRVRLYDTGGNEVQTRPGFITVLLPGQTLGVGGTVLLGANTEITDMEVELEESSVAPSEVVPEFATGAVSYQQALGNVSGVINNPFDRNVKDIAVSSLVYDEDGNIVGGGLTFLSFVAAEESTGVVVPTVASGAAASAELYATLGTAPGLAFEGDPPDGVRPLEVAAQGFGQAQPSVGGARQVGLAFVLENPNDGHAAEGGQYRATLYSADGQVVAVEEGNTGALLPKQALGVARELLLPQDATVDRVEVQVRASNFVETELKELLLAENVELQETQSAFVATGEIVNPYPVELRNLRVSAIAYDEDGEIIGGGLTTLDRLPAEGLAPVRVIVAAAEKPAIVELHAAVPSLASLVE